MRPEEDAKWAETKHRRAGSLILTWFAVDAKYSDNCGAR